MSMNFHFETMFPLATADCGPTTKKPTWRSKCKGSFVAETVTELCEARIRVELIEGARQVVHNLSQNQYCARLGKLWPPKQKVMRIRDPSKPQKRVASDENTLPCCPPRKTLSCFIAVL